MVLTKVVITTPDGKQKIVESGDQNAWNQLTPTEKDWIMYLRNNDIQVNDRTLFVDGTKYRPTYKRAQTTQTKGRK